MIEELVNLFQNEDIDGIKKLVKQNYQELGELVYGISVSGEYIQGPDDINLYALIIKVLSEAGHKLDYVDDNGNSALLGAVKFQDKDMVIAFDGRDELFTQPNKDKITPIALAYTLENEEIKMFCTMKLGEHVNDIFPINGENMTYFALAIFTSSSNVCKAITLNENFDYDIHKQYLTDIEWDDSDEDKEKQELINLLESGKKFELEDSEPYNPGDENSELEQMNQGLSPLLFAVAQDDIEKVKELIADGAKINYRNTAGFTPLFLAVMKNNYEMSKLLIENGAFVNCQLYNGLTPILKAYLGESEELFDLLLENNVYIENHTYNALINMSNKSEVQEKMTEKIKSYNNPPKRKQIFPYEYMYELGYNETYDGDGYHGVQDVFIEKYGTNCITSYDYLSVFGMCPIISIEHKESSDGLMTRGPSEYYNGMKIAILFKNGKVDAFDVFNNTRESIFKGENIIQIESTNYNIVGLTKDGRVLIDDNKIAELEEVKTWTNIKKIAAGNSSIFAITNDGEFKYAVSKMDKYMIGDALLSIINEIKEKNFKLKDIAAHNFYLGYVTIDGKVRLIANMTNAEGGLINDIEDAEQISINNHFVILRKNHTLFAFGDNTYNQCNIAKWHDIVRVQATHFNTIGYASNGEILCTDCMFKRNGNNSSPLGEFLSTMLKPEGFGNLTSMGKFVPDAIQIAPKEVE